MFVKYFHLGSQPFGATPDPRFLYQSASHREALASLYCAYRGNRGFTALIAQPGMGKTTLLYEFLDHIHHRSRTVFLFNTLCEPEELISYVLQDLGIRPEEDAVANHHTLNQFLAAEAREDRHVVLVIDEAQNLPLRTLEGLRLLTNFETSRAKLLQIVLAGQPQLADSLNQPEAAQLAQRISTVCHLDPLSRTETYNYIEHRLRVAGHSTHRSPFTAEALKLIAEESHGIPRVINTLCYNSLCLCAARRANQVDAKMVQEVRTDLEMRGVRSIQASPAVSGRSEPKVPAIEDLRVPLPHGVPLWTAVLLLTVCAVLFCGRLWLTNGRSLAPPQPFVSNSLTRLTTRSINPETLAKASAASSQAKALGGSSPTTAISSGENSAQQKVTIGQGDTLEQIAIAQLGEFNQTILRQIRELNPEITDPNHIEAGRMIRLPGPTAMKDPNTLVEKEQ